MKLISGVSDTELFLLLSSVLPYHSCLALKYRTSKDRSLKHKAAYIKLYQ